MLLGIAAVAVVASIFECVCETIVPNAASTPLIDRAIILWNKAVLRVWYLAALNANICNKTHLIVEPTTLNFYFCFLFWGGNNKIDRSTCKSIWRAPTRGRKLRKCNLNYETQRLQESRKNFPRDRVIQLFFQIA